MDNTEIKKTDMGPDAPQTGSVSPKEDSPPTPATAAAASDTGPVPETPDDHPAVGGLSAWFDEHMRNSIFSRDVVILNRITAAVQEIKNLIHQKIGG